MAARKVTANQVTIAAALGSFVTGGVLALFGRYSSLFLLLPLWMFIRMALNAIDGMLARDFNQQSRLGAFLNELCDVVALVVFLSVISEFAGVLGVTVGASRRYDGPLGKSDRAFVFGALGLWVGVAEALPTWLYGLMPLLAILLTVTIVNRVKRALSQAASQ